jgi:hypothetical protein
MNIFTVSTYPILPSIAGGLGFSFRNMHSTMINGRCSVSGRPYNGTKQSGSTDFNPRQWQGLKSA